mmetsp:Transcript_90662/g.270571  ORF Transcript_90662/g.270571 Transcript_90662/m.270571 type:complete len:422 (+) Transcript_90662:360-1625(+)
MDNSVQQLPCLSKSLFSAASSRASFRLTSSNLADSNEPAEQGVRWSSPRLRSEDDVRPVETRSSSTASSSSLTSHQGMDGALQRRHSSLTALRQSLRLRNPSSMSSVRLPLWPDASDMLSAARGLSCDVRLQVTSPVETERPPVAVETECSLAPSSFRVFVLSQTGSSRAGPTGTLAQVAASWNPPSFPGSPQPRGLAAPAGRGGLMMPFLQSFLRSRWRSLFAAREVSTLPASASPASEASSEPSHEFLVFNEAIACITVCSKSFATLCSKSSHDCGEGCKSCFQCLGCSALIGLLPPRARLTAASMEVGSSWSSVGQATVCIDWSSPGAASLKSIEARRGSCCWSKGWTLPTKPSALSWNSACHSACICVRKWPTMKGSLILAASLRSAEDMDDHAAQQSIGRGTEAKSATQGTRERGG